MYIIEKLKLNRFQDVNIPDNKSYFMRFGLTSPSSGSMTGDEMAPVAKTKIDTFADMEEFDRIRQQEESSKTE